MNTAAAAMLLALMTPLSVVAEPQVLADEQLDGVTAGGVLVDVNSFATGFGDFARTLTDADTFVIMRRNYDLAIGLTFGHGFACCGQRAAVQVGSNLLGVGDIVHQATLAVRYDDGYLAQGVSMGYVVALTLKEPFLQLRDAFANGKSRLVPAGGD